MQSCLPGGYAVLSDEMEGMPKRPKGPFGPLSHDIAWQLFVHTWHGLPSLPFLSGSLSASGGWFGLAISQIQIGWFGFESQGVSGHLKGAWTQIIAFSAQDFQNVKGWTCNRQFIALPLWIHMGKSETERIFGGFWLERERETALWDKLEICSSPARFPGLELSLKFISYPTGGCEAVTVGIMQS